MESDEKTLLKHWVKIYPTYLDKTLKVSEGRKVANTLAVETPTLQEIAEICNHHPKDWLKRGRILVELKVGDKPIHGNIPNKNTLLKEICKGISENRERNTSQSSKAGGGDKKRRNKK